MSNPKAFFFRLLSALIALGLPVDLSFAASIDEVLTSLKGLSPKERLARVESEARKEGSVHWASSTPQAWAEPALQIFRKRYRMIQVEYRSQSGRVLAERVIREHRAGKYEIDVVGTSIVTFAGMKDSGVIAPYLSPEAGQIRSNMKDPEGWELRAHTPYRILASKATAFIPTRSRVVASELREKLKLYLR